MHNYQRFFVEFLEFGRVLLLALDDVIILDSNWKYREDGTVKKTVVPTLLSREKVLWPVWPYQTTLGSGLFNIDIGHYRIQQKALSFSP